ncbi:DUF4825 domain-containing protein [Aureibacillus halotolerans]|uniref:Uncharacterized protein DUF4825 n=1 Tax=Aureibacillus halotolerans TaxID=1508390 RepID=A0A4R6U8X7_9BACI|nr:DUF4825 domain-containing protein [Aureibacillus halotolerans]TDQ41105.1 uncharacterized protein DUF4825 [Aureibacillus halotolerans]
MSAKRFVIIMFLLLGVLSGCSQGQAEQKIVTIMDMDNKKLATFAGTYIGDNSAVVSLMNSLPGGGLIKEISLYEESLHATYGTDDTSINYWYGDSSTLQSNVMYNAFYTTLLIPNAKAIQFTMPETSFTAERGTVLKWMNENLSELPGEESIWEQDNVENYLQQNGNLIQEAALSDDLKQSFFKQMPLDQ